MFRRLLLPIIAAFCAVEAHACAVPVFRYALDRWPADPYELQISAPDAKDESVARFLRNFTDSTPLNLAPQRTKESGESRLRFPHAAPDAAPTWSGALDSHSLPQLTESPARTELSHRILAGETAVWLLVESGEREADDRAATTLQSRLRYLEQAAQIPPIDPDDPTNELGPGPALRVKFSVLRLHRDDPAEQSFLRMLAGPKHDAPPSQGPWLALVFGRGRVLGAWPAEGFGNEQIDEACLFLLGACSCQVKRLNPGWDLLMNVNWDEALHEIGFPKATETTPATTTATPPDAAPATVTQVANPAPADTAKVEAITVTATTAPAVLTPAHGDNGRLAGIAAGVMLVLGSVFAWRTMRRQP